MKFSVCLAVAALTLCAGAYAQTAQTFRFGEGQGALPPGHAPASESRPKQKAKHHRHHRGHVTQPDAYSHS